MAFLSFAPSFLSAQVPVQCGFDCELSPRVGGSPPQLLFQHCGGVPAGSEDKFSLPEPCLFSVAFLAGAWDAPMLAFGTAEETLPSRSGPGTLVLTCPAGGMCFKRLSPWFFLRTPSWCEERWGVLADQLLKVEVPPAPAVVLTRPQDWGFSAEPSSRECADLSPVSNLEKPG